MPPHAPPHFSPRPPRSKPGSGNKNLIFGVLVLVIVGLGVFAWMQYRSNQELKAQAELADQAAKAAAAAQAKQLADNPPPAPNDFSGDNPQRGMAAIGNLLNNPQARQALDAFAGNAIDNLYAGLFQQLNLDADQTAALRALILKRSSAATDAFAVAAQGGDMSNIRQTVADAQAGVDQQIQGLLGASGYQQYQAYTANLRGNFGGPGAQGPGGFQGPGGIQGPGN
jgi:hypothetical protein